jgi:chromosome segregation ATPase
MRQNLAVLTASFVLAVLSPHGALAADEDTTARLREMLHRTQEALRQAQADNAELTRAKSDTDQKLQAASRQLDASQSGARATAVSLSARLTAAEGGRSDLERKLGATGEQLASTTATLTATSRDLAARDTEIAALRQTLEQSKAANAGCETKNLALYGYADELLQRYKSKGVWAALSQKEPVFGLKEVEVENVVQEYRLKFAAEKVKP